MIINDDKQVTFIHIPKCAGQTVTFQLSDYDSYAGGFRRHVTHPVMGYLYLGHIPLTFLRDHFPVEFDKVRRYHSFALTRDPLERFASATFQRLEEFKGVPKLQATSEMALAEAREVMLWLTGRETFYDFEYIHFARQVDYIRLDGETIVSNVYSIDDIGQMSLDMETYLGFRFDPDKRENTNFASNNRAMGIIQMAKPIYSRLVPWSLRKKLLMTMRKAQRQDANDMYQSFRQDENIKSFVAGYYGEDYALHAEATVRARRRREAVA